MHDFSDNDNSILTPKELLAVFFVTIGLIFLVATLTLFVGSRVVTLIGELAIIVPAAVYVIWQKKSFKKTFRLNPINISILFYTLLITAVVFVLTDELDRIITQIFPLPDEFLVALEGILKVNSVYDALVLFLAAVIGAGFAEEMLFRGVLQRTLEFYREPAIAIVLTAVLFALAHFIPWTAIQITVLGLVLGYLSWKSKSIFPAVILHGSNNLFSIILANKSPQDLSWYASGTHVNWWWIGLALVVFVPVLNSFNRACDELANDRSVGKEI